LKEEFYSHADALIGICPDVSLMHVKFWYMLFSVHVLSRQRHTGMSWSRCHK
jgi:hypothetical protein